MEIIQERLEREYDLDLITTAPTVVYEVETTSREVIYVDSPSKLPAVNNIYELREPIAECHMLLPQAYLGNVITLCVEKRGVQTNMVYHGNQVALTYEIPMAEVVRKKKLLQKQKEGKKRMKQIGNVELPQEAFLAILHVGKDNK